MSGGWRALHVFCHDHSLQDGLVLRLAGTATATGRRWFFLRYWLGGPHIRLRIEGACPRQWEEVRRVASEYPAAPAPRELDRDLFYAGIPESLREGRLGDGTLPWYPSGTVREERYEPEYERYGGTDMMPVAESVFHRSSVLCTEVISSTPGVRARLGVAAYIMRGFVERLGLSEQLARYARFWESAGSAPLSAQAVDALAVAAVRSPSLPAVDVHLDAIATELETLPREMDPAQRALILTSQIHMTNNRLSVAPAVEAMLARSLRGAYGGVD